VAAPGELDEEQINRDIAAGLKRSRRVIWALLGLMGAILVVVSVTAAVLAARQVGEHARIVNTINRQTSGLCLFFYHTAVNIPPYPLLAQSEAAVQFRIDARQAVAQLGCPQHLPRPPRQLVAAAAKYQLAIPY